MQAFRIGRSSEEDRVRYWLQSSEMTGINHLGTADTSLPESRPAGPSSFHSVSLCLGILFSCAAVSAQGVRSVEPAPHTQEAIEHTKILASGAVVSDVLAINPFAFEGLEASDIAALRVEGIERYCERSNSLPCLIEAPLELPTGTVVTRLELDAVDNGPSFVKANFYRCPIGATACTLLAEVSTDGTPGATQVGVDLAAPETVDNQTFTYLLEVFPGDDGLTRLVGARLVLSGAESTARDEVLVLHAYAFEGRTPGDRAALGADGVQRFCSGSSCTLAAPVELPSGSSVTRIELDAIDNGAADVAAGFSRCDAATGLCASVASVSSSGVPGSTQPEFDLVSPETIDNVNFTYRAEVSLGADDETRLVGLRLFFDVPAALPKTDRLAVNPFAFEGRDATDSAVLDETADGRFCNGLACVMLAPVELPSGTRVDRLELAARDNSSYEVRAAFLRCQEGSQSCIELVAVSTDTEVSVDLASPETIDNEGFTYALEVQSGPNADTTLRGVSLVIKRALIFSDGFGTGDTSPWSNTVP